MRLSALEFGHGLCNGSKEVLLNGTECLELVSKVSGTSRLILDELVDQTIGNASKSSLTLLVLVLVLLDDCMESAYTRIILLGSAFDLLRICSSLK